MNFAVDTYVSMAEAEAYFGTRLDVAAWTSATATQKKAALVTAAQALEQYNWVGHIADPQQPLAWPRVGTYFEPRLGYATELSGVPKRVKHAQLELAYHYLNNDGVLDSSGGVREVQVGPIVVKGVEAPSATSEIAHKLLAPLVLNTSRHWWRAN